jgi:hypothetical protein
MQQEIIIDGQRLQPTEGCACPTCELLRSLPPVSPWTPEKQPLCIVSGRPPAMPAKPWELHDDPTPEMRRAYALLLGMTEGQRGRVLCWFCDGCRRYVGPGDSCTCMRDE